MVATATRRLSETKGTKSLRQRGTRQRAHMSAHHMLSRNGTRKALSFVPCSWADHLKRHVSAVYLKIKRSRGAK